MRRRRLANWLNSALDNGARPGSASLPMAASVVGLLLILAACSPSNASQSPPAPAATQSSTVEAAPPPPRLPVTSPAPGSLPTPDARAGAGQGSPANAAAQAAAVDAAVRDAAGRLSLASGAGDLRVQQVEAREWPDSALGCPKPGVMYAQVVTPGFLVIINGAGRELEYHADSRGRIILCSEV
jgi:hypothetical protein